VAIKLKIPQRKKQSGRARGRFGSKDPIIKIAVSTFIILSMVIMAVFAYQYVKYDRIIDKKMKGQIFNNAAKIYARAPLVQVGDKSSVETIATDLRRTGYVEEGKGESGMGTFRLAKGSIEIHPGPESFHSSDGAAIHVSEGKIDRITGTGGADGQSLAGFELEPQLVTALFEGEQRSKRQLVKFDEIPGVLVSAVLAIEDRRFFQHNGVNYLRLAEAVWSDIRSGHKGQGGSTLTMQISRGFFLTPEKTVKRKAIEMLIAIELEQKFTKPQIFELYANQVPMGQRGSFAISGMGEAARAYFNKDIKSLTLPEAAMLAGIIQRPSYLSPYRHPERALERRNLVLDSMVETNAITKDQAEKAKATPLKLAPPNVEASDAPYFVDLVKETLQSKYSEQDLNEQGLRIYTTIDPDLQLAAAQAVEAGVKSVDEQVAKVRTRKKKIGTGKNAKTETEVTPGPPAQFALVAIDPHTGEVLALVGGRNYGFSQLNHAVAKRPTGSIFKPFVYAAALNSALQPDDPDKILTNTSLIDDSPTTFSYGEQIYEPRNYKNEYHGQVTARYALAHSLNNATVKLAETVGYDKVAALARQAGIVSVKPTPAMALGAYDASPLDMAGAYTVFANNGEKIEPLFMRSVRSSNGDVVEDFSTSRKPVLDPRIAYVMTDMMESVVNNGTGNTVRLKGFTAPAAGKTGTSHDGWFAGYTTNLLCIVWVGFDDYSDLRLSGSVTAAPIWADFMKKAVAMAAYHDAGNFKQPTGVVDVQLDKVTNRLATAACPETYSAAFVAGTEPHDTCEQMDTRNAFQKLFGVGQAPPPAVIVNGPAKVLPPGPQGQQQGQQQAAQQQPKQEPEKKKGFFGKLAGIFGGGDDKDKDKKPPNQQQNQGTGNNPPRR
jgi:penicillin-binding protein 1B